MQKDLSNAPNIVNRTSRIGVRARGFYTRTLLRSRYCGLAGFEIMQKTIRPEIGTIKSVYLCAVTSNTGYRLANGLNVSTGEPAAIGK